METTRSITTTYNNKVGYLDTEIILAHSLGKTREFVLMHPEYALTLAQQRKFSALMKRRLKGEPVAYLLGHKEFYGLDFAVNKHTLIPRPETELMVEQALDLLRSMLRNNVRTCVVDVGTGSGCIIISIAKTFANSGFPVQEMEFIGTDISKDALLIAKKNAKNNGVGKKIKFFQGNLLDPILKAKKPWPGRLMPDKLVITANLPYLSRDIYTSAPIDVKKFEPKSALYSPKAGLAHYHKLLKQVQKILVTSYELQVTAFLEISPEQKIPITKLIKNIFPKAKITFIKDLAGKWRICKIIPYC